MLQSFPVRVHVIKKNTPNRENYSETKVLKSIFPAIRITESIICSVIIIKNIFSKIHFFYGKIILHVFFEKLFKNFSRGGEKIRGRTRRYKCKDCE